MITLHTFPVNPLGENCYVLSDDTREAVVIDCGAQAPDEQAALSDYLDREALHPVAHLLTHAHFDHCLGARYLYDRYGLCPRMAEADLPLYEQLPQQMELLMGSTLSSVPPPAGAPLAAGQPLHFGTHSLDVIPCPGHTPGGIALHCVAEHLLFSGDSLFRASIGRTDLPGGNHWDLIRSLHHLLRDLPDDTAIYPGHGPATTAAFERTHNPFL